MVVKLGERDAAIPLRSLQREFGIPDDSDDGRMLGLIAQSLDFVTGVQIGDALPTEVLTGQASWEPDACAFADRPGSAAVAIGGMAEFGNRC